MLSSESGWDLVKSLGLLFKNATDEDVQQLISHPNTGLALLAGWQRVRGGLPSAQRTGKGIALDPEDLSRFFGLVEGRTRVPLPQAWEAVVRSATTRDGRRLYFPRADKAEVEVGPNADNLGEDREINVRRNDDHWIVTVVGERPWTLPCKGFDGDRGRAELTKSMAYVLVYIDLPGSYLLSAIDRHTGNVVWSTKVWAQGDLGALTGLWHHNTETRLTGTQIIVFGTSVNAVYIEAFDVNTGENLWRFGNSYLEQSQ